MPEATAPTIRPRIPAGPSTRPAAIGASARRPAAAGVPARCPTAVVGGPIRRSAEPTRPLLGRRPSAPPTLGSELFDSALLFGLVAAVIAAVTLLVLVLHGWS